MKTNRRGFGPAGSGTMAGEMRRMLCVVLCATSIAPVYPDNGRDLGDLSIEELLNESVTSVSKREQKLGDVASAISVLSNEDLRRSGATTLVDALRQVPGMNVAAVNASQSAVSARGFNNVYANKLLVLVDGRAVYTPLFAGVYWDFQQTMMEDVDRVEVIRGPGATVWGANAVNGVINVVTRGARETQGSFVYGGAGAADRRGGVRHGAAAGKNTFYRVFGSFQANDSRRTTNGQNADDGWHGWHGGVRVDHHPDDLTQVTWQSDASGTNLDADESHGYMFNTLGRWTHALAGDGKVEAQAYYDRVHRDEAHRSRATSDTIDFTLQHTFPAGERHDVNWGFGYRFSEFRVGQTDLTVDIRNRAFGLGLYSAFLQDEFKVVPDRLTLTGGVKIEHNDFTGIELQPSVRAVFKPAEQGIVWIAVSRAVRTPSALEGSDVFGMAIGAPMPGPGGGLYLPKLVGNANPDSEVVWSYELGGRVQLSRRVSVDVATFHNRYSDLISAGEVAAFTPGAPFGTAEIPFINAMNSDTFGAETSVAISPTGQWRLNVAHSMLFVRTPGLSPEIHYDPKHQLVLRSSHDFGSRVSLDLQLRRIGGFTVPISFTGETVAAYTEADVRLAYRPTAGLELSLVGQNLLDRSHPEQGPAPFTATSEVPRRVHGKVLWRF